jgi:hypothetical protein
LSKLAGPVGADHGVDRTLNHGQRDPVEGLYATKPQSDVGDREQRLSNRHGAAVQGETIFAGDQIAPLRAT